MFKEIDPEKLGYAFGMLMKSTSIRSLEGYQKKAKEFFENCEIVLSNEEFQAFVRGNAKAYKKEQ